MEKLCVVKTIEPGYKKYVLISLIVVSVALVVSAFLFGKAILIVGAIGVFAAYLIYYFSPQISYDYTYFGTEMKIARIKGNYRRKLLYTINLEEARMLTKDSDPILYNVEKEPGIIKKDFSSRTGEGQLYKLAFSNNGKSYLFTLEPTEDFIDALCEKYQRIITR